jgi:NYN domain
VALSYGAGPRLGALLFMGSKVKTIVYIDGFNLYYGCLKGSRNKWLDLFALFEKILPTSCNLIKVKYFTARAKPLANDPDAPIRQDIYLRALNSFYPRKIEIIEGHFLLKNKRVPLLSSPHNMVEIIQAEEKGSDVNLAVELVNDGWLDIFDCAAVVSNDSDLQRAMQIIKQQRKKKVFLFTPGAPLKRRPVAALTKWCHKQFNISENDLSACQLPDPLPSGITKPKYW